MVEEAVQEAGGAAHREEGEHRGDAVDLVAEIVAVGEASGAALPAGVSAEGHAASQEGAEADEGVEVDSAAVEEDTKSKCLDAVLVCCLYYLFASHTFGPMPESVSIMHE